MCASVICPACTQILNFMVLSASCSGFISFRLLSEFLVPKTCKERLVYIAKVTLFTIATDQ